MTISEKKKSRIKIIFFIYNWYLLKWTSEEIKLNYKLHKINKFEKESIERILENMETYEQRVIEILTDKWSWDRINILDRSLIINALDEITVDKEEYKLSINEAIEISKIYSDPKAYKIINKILNDLK